MIGLLIAHVIPVFKAQAGRYIEVTPVISELFESVIRDAVVNHYGVKQIAK